MSKKSLGQLGLWLCTGVLAMVSGLAQAKPGLDHQFSEPNYADGRLQLDVLDLQVQALGAPIRILRTWKNGQWLFNERWNDLEVLGAADASASAADPANADKPYAIVRAGQSYLRSSTTAQGQDLVFNNLPQRTLTALQHGLAGYRWQDALGNRNEYDAQGRMTAYLDHNGVRTTLVRNADGRISEIKDHNGDSLITLTYTAGNLTSVKDYSGREVKYEYSGNRLSAVVDVLGKRWQYHYDTYGLAGYTDPLQQRTTYILGTNDRVQEYRLPDGRFSKYSYSYDDAEGQYYLRKLDQAGLVTERWYDRLGQPTREQLDGETQFTRSYLLSDRSSDVSKVAEAYRITGKSLAVSKEISQRQGRSPSPYVAQMTEVDAHGNKTLTEYNRLGQVTRVLYADGSEIKKSYHPETNRVAEEISERGIKTQYRYDGKGNLVELIEAVGLVEENSTTYRYGVLGQLVQEDWPADVDAQTPAARWQYEYDSKGNRSLTRDPLGYESRYIYDQLGNVVTFTNAREKEWSSSYDAVGNLKGLESPLNQKIKYTYDDLGRRIVAQGPNGATKTIEPNAAGLPKSVIDAGNARTQFQYDSSQRLIAVIDPDGSQSEDQYDNRGRLVSRKDQAGNSTYYQYKQNLLAGIDHPTFKERYEYDNRERQVIDERSYSEHEETKAQRNQYRYFSGGFQLIDSSQNASGYSYDNLGRLISFSDAAGKNVSFSYDRRGNLTKVVDAVGRITIYRYDARNALMTEVKAGGDLQAVERNYFYDGIGNLIKAVTPDGRVSVFSYDDANRVQRIDYIATDAGSAGPVVGQSMGSVDYSYNDLNLLAGFEDENSKVVYSYDAMGRVKDVITTYKSATPAFSKAIHYAYDLNGRKISYTNPEQQIYSYRYTANDRLAGVNVPGEGGISFLDFKWLAPQNILFPGGNQYGVSYNGLQRYESRELRDVAGNSILRHVYEYDAVGNVISIDDQSGRSTYSYDKLHRLVEASYSDGDGRKNEAFSYDGADNRLDKANSLAEINVGSWRYNAHNQLVSRDGVGYRYNKDGSLIERGAISLSGVLAQTDAIDHWLYIYDSRERLFEVRKNGQPLVRYSYNALGQRISKTLIENSDTTYFLYSEEGLVAEYDGKGELVQEYAYDPTAPWMGRPLFTRARSTTAHSPEYQVHYYGINHLGVPEVAFLKSGEVTWRAKMQAFGEVVFALSDIKNPLRFPGQYFDQETGLSYNLLRDYDSSLGRYIQADPLSLNGGLNPYVYVDSSPLVNVDYFGLSPECLTQECASIQRRVCMLRKELEKRYKEYEDDPGKLPWRLSPNEKLRDTRRGHVTKINETDSRLRKAEDEWDSQKCPGEINCDEPPPSSGVRAPVPDPLLEGDRPGQPTIPVPMGRPMPSPKIRCPMGACPTIPVFYM